MIATIKDGSPAFPCEFDLIGTNHASATGMTLRDYFAAKAMQGICSHENTWGCGIEEIGIRAYQVADAMIAARGKA